MRCESGRGQMLTAFFCFQVANRVQVGIKLDVRLAIQWMDCWPIVAILDYGPI